MSRWLITGGAGFIGCNLVRSLCAEGGHRIRVLDTLDAGELLAAVGPLAQMPAGECDAVGSAEDIEFVVGDVLNAEAVQTSARGRDVIVHLAANTGILASLKDPERDCIVNVLGTLKCLEAARREGVARFVFASSAAVVGEAQLPLHEDKVARPFSPYGASKLASEAYCSAYFRSFGVETVALRFGNVYGPGSGHKTSVVAAFIKCALAGEPLAIYGDGEQTRDFVYVGDLARAIRKAATAPGVGGHVFQIASAHETTVADLARLLVDILARRGVHGVRLRHQPLRSGEVQRSLADTSKAAALLGWRAKVSLEAGLTQTVDWFLNQTGGDGIVRNRGASRRPETISAAGRGGRACRPRSPCKRQ